MPTWRSWSASELRTGVARMGAGSTGHRRGSGTSIICRTGCRTAPTVEPSSCGRRARSSASRWSASDRRSGCRRASTPASPSSTSSLEPGAVAWVRRRPDACSGSGLDGGRSSSSPPTRLPSPSGAGWWGATPEGSSRSSRSGAGPRSGSPAGRLALEPRVERRDAVDRPVWLDRPGVLEADEVVHEARGVEAPGAETSTSRA